MPLNFQITARSNVSHARTGVVTTPHGSFETPAFMPVGTRGSVKGLLPSLVRDTGAQIILGNTYHLLLRPGPDLIHKLGGLQRFTGWHGPMLTDSGGYQAFSMSDSNTLTEDGVKFRSIVDGALVTITPESAMQIQNALGADIIMAFDDCPPTVAATPAALGTVPAESSRTRPRTKQIDHALRVRQACERTIRWLDRCQKEHARLDGPAQRALFPIVQGGTDLDLRNWCVKETLNFEAPGYAIGGVAVGETSAEIAKVVQHTAPLLPIDKLRYLMGVGYERDLLAAVQAGVDMFDCVLPTRNGRNASAFTSTGPIRLRNAKFTDDPLPIEPGCDCAACDPAKHLSTFNSNPSQTSSPSPAQVLPFSRAYIRHLFFAQEMLGPILVSIHNLRHFQRFMADIRRTILTDAWGEFLQRWPVAGQSETEPSDDHTVDI